MRILFICGSLEPGRDGVGDYTRRLGTELIRQGHMIYLISINDRHIKSSFEDTEEYDGKEMPLLRLASVVPYSERFLHLDEIISTFNPEWISLQFVPFSFQKKGLTWWFGNLLAGVGKERKWHLMFHELWVGMDAEAPLKHRMLGGLQEIFIKDFIKKLDPLRIHTQSSLYKEKLGKLGFRVELLPLFSNIPVVSQKVEKNRNHLSLIVFGMIQPGAPIAQFSKELAEYGEETGKKVGVTFIGRNGSELDRWVASCTTNNIGVKVLGEKSSVKISESLHKADWGISSTPFYQCEKSGTIAAMREHNLPVYCVSRPWNLRSPGNLPTQEDIKEYQPGKLDFTHKSASPANRLENVAQLFSEELANLK